jgi:Flp pilus assembly protein TadB
MSLLVLLAVVAGLGVFLLIRELYPAPPALRPALARFSQPAVTPQPAGLRERAARQLAVLAGATPLNKRVPRQDLSLLGQSSESYLARQAALGLAGLAVPFLVWTLLRPPLPWIVLVLVTLCLTVFLIALPGISVRREAAAAREEFRESLTAYLDLVALARAAGAAPAGALEVPVRICHGWVFTQLASALDPARRGSASTWDALSDLAARIGIPELAQTAATVRLAGTQGSAIAATLAARAQSLRETRLAAALARAKSRTETMTIPMTAAVAGFVILLGYPALIRMTGG